MLTKNINGCRKYEIFLSSCVVINNEDSYCTPTCLNAGINKQTKKPLSCKFQISRHENSVITAGGIQFLMLLQIINEDKLQLLYAIKLYERYH